MSLALDHTIADAEAAFLESMRPYYEGRNYRFIVHPVRTDLPEFMASYVPDAIAVKDGDNIAIELMSRATPTAHPSIVRTRKLFEDRADWRLTVVNMGREPSDAQEMSIIGREAILQRANEVEKLAEKDDIAAALVMAWGLLEATLNNLYPDADKRPRRPGTVVQTLSMNGNISYEIEQTLRPLIDLRNRIVHGDLSALPSANDVRQVLVAVRSALEQPAADAVG